MIREINAQVDPLGRRRKDQSILQRGIASADYDHRLTGHPVSFFDT